MSQERLWPVILSGGSGTRLWPLSRASMPKQLLALTSERTMLQETALRRVAGRDHGPLVICGAAHAQAIAAQLAEIGIVPEGIVVEPCARNTAPAIAFAAVHIAARDPAGVMLVMPSDHVIDRPEALLAAIDRARAPVDQGWLATFGIAPSAPETGYGYIETGAEIAPGVHAARRFVEKPDAATASAMLADGGFTWNGGIFMFRADAFLAVLAEHAPAVLAAVNAAHDGAATSGALIHPAAAAFTAAPSISVDYAVMEKAARVAVVPVDMGWSDIGGWDALHAHGPATADGNIHGGSGRIETIATRDCLLRAEGTTLATIGIDGLIVVATPDAVLVAARGEGQAVRDIAARLAGDAALDRPVVIAHAWGTERLVSDGAGLRVRQIDVGGGATWACDTAAQVMLIEGSATGDGAALALGTLAHARSVTTERAARLLVFGDS